MIALLPISWGFFLAVCVCYTLTGGGRGEGSICIICAVCEKKSGTLFCKSTFKLPQ